MSSIQRCELPQAALLRRYQREGAYADCYVTDVAGQISHAAFVEAFYTTWLFKVEARLLAWLVAKPSTDAQARQLATGATETFAAWSVEKRAVDQLLLCDFQGRTRSWLMVAATTGTGTVGTRLYFGSAVVPVLRRGASQPQLGPVFRLLLGFHKLYSRALLGAAKSRLARL
jgi:hypothetical protein